MITLQDYLDKLEHTEIDGLSKERQRAIYWDLKRFVSYAHVDGDARKIQAVPRIITQHLDRMLPADLKMEDERFRNFCSNVRAALKKVNIEGAIYSYVKDLPEAWQQLLDRVDLKEAMLDPKTSFSKHQLIKLRSFAKSVVAAGIMKPKDIGLEIYLDLLPIVKEQSFKKTAVINLRDGAVTWNKCKVLFQDWPGEKIIIPNKRDFWVPVADMHPDLQKEIVAYQDYMRDPVKVDLQRNKQNKRFEPYSEGTIKIHTNRLRYAVTCLLLKGHRLNDLTSIQNLVSPKAMGLVSEVYRERKEEELRQIYSDGIQSDEFLEKTSGEHTIIRDLRTIAHNLYNVPAAVCSAMYTILQNTRSATYDLGDRKITVHMKSHGLSEKNKRVVDSILTNDEKHKDYLELSRKIMDQVEERRQAGANHKIDDFYAFQNAIGFAILINGVMRPGDLAKLNLATEYRKTTASEVHVAEFIYYEQKVGKRTKELTIRPISKDLNEYFKLYLEHYRPWFLKGQSSNYVFPGENPKKHITTSRLASRISKFVESHLKIKYHCHSNRHITGSHIVRDNPANVTLASKALGHKRQTTTEEYYLPDQTETALKHRDELNKGITNNVL
ncbi:tyrosine-type recombinase/integrase [Curvivirga sp.]|uniref:tyrosine-type recombinase/integrase n=1 Tax=Curvivirga sp. TaxID=2856848 RepID=UPI003B5AE650